tara:strand:- start:1310 stop:2395 length:1086 start_codon:yes stop_codon:yes gene_type:complete
MFVADLHNDLVQRAMIGEDISKLTNCGHTDLTRLTNSCIDLEVLAIWVSTIPKNESAFKKANEMYDKLEKIVSNSRLVKIPKSLEEIIKHKTNNLLSLTIAIEGGEAIENSLDKLNHFIEKGIVYFGPTWNYSLDWVSSAYDEVNNRENLKHLGLSEFGKDVIKTCNENGVIVDVSHIGEKSFWDIASFTNKPFIASHSSVYELCPHFRNLKNDQIKEIKKSKGLIGLNPYPYFIDPNFKKKEVEFLKDFKEEISEIIDKNKEPNARWILKQHYLQKKLKNIVPSFEIFIDHIEYVIKLIGIDYVGVGSDYDGLDCLPKGWKDCLDHIKISELLDKRGYSNYEIEKIMGKNFLRVMEAVTH